MLCQVVKMATPVVSTAHTQNTRVPQTFFHSTTAQNKKIKERSCYISAKELNVQTQNLRNGKPKRKKKEKRKKERKKERKIKHTTGSTAYIII